MNKLSGKIILLFMAVTLLPAVPMALVVNSLIRRSVGVGADARSGRALQAALEVYREKYAACRAELLAGLAEWPAADTASFMDRHGLTQIEIVSLDGKSLRRWNAEAPSFAPPAAEIFQRGDPKTGLLAVDRVDGRLMQVGRLSVGRLSVGRLSVARSSRDRLSAGRRADTTVTVFTRLLPAKWTADAAEVRDALQRARTLGFVMEDVHRAFLLSFLVVYLPVLALAAGLAIFFSRKITAPLTGLAAATEQVAAGRRDIRLPESGDDEIGQVVRSFNRMTGQLQENQDRLVHLEKTAAWREIARVLAHEIKNPLTPIQLTIQQLRDKYDGSDARYAALLENCTSIIHDEVEALRRLVGEFSDFARMPAMKMETARITEVIAEAVRLFGAYPVSFHPGPVPAFPMDAEKMRRVFINLLENAAAAAGAEGRVEIRLAPEESRVRVTVSDNGPGIPPGAVERIFEPYFTTKHRGMGLGLAVVRKVIEEHGGRVTAANRPEGGACFTLVLPLEHPQPPGDRVGHETADHR